jgi:hypothetical protein
MQRQLGREALLSPFCLSPRQRLETYIMAHEHDGHREVDVGPGYVLCQNYNRAYKRRRRWDAVLGDGIM